MSEKLVLIADDEEDIRHFMKMLVEFFGYKAVTAADGQQAVAAAIQYKPSLILMDLAMPYLDGFKAISKLKADPSTLGIPIIAFSGLYVDTPVRAQLIKAGCSDFLAKPIDTDALYESMTMAIRGEQPQKPPEEDSPLKVDIDLDAEQHRRNIGRLIKFFKK